MSKVTTRGQQIPKGIMFVLKRFGNALAGHYGCPVYLCGSALISSNRNPRDYDIRIEMPDDDFTERFGSVPLWIEQGLTGDWTKVRWKWSDECVHQTKAAWKETLLNIDFQIYPKSYCTKFMGLPKKRLDTRRKTERKEKQGERPPLPS